MIQRQSAGTGKTVSAWKDTAENGYSFGRAYRKVWHSTPTGYIKALLWWAHNQYFAHKLVAHGDIKFDSACIYALSSHLDGSVHLDLSSMRLIDFEYAVYLAPPMRLALPAVPYRLDCDFNFYLNAIRQAQVQRDATTIQRGASARSDVFSRCRLLREFVRETSRAGGIVANASRSPVPRSVPGPLVTRQWKVQRPAYRPLPRPWGRNYKSRSRCGARRPRNRLGVLWLQSIRCQRLRPSQRRPLCSRIPQFLLLLPPPPRPRGWRTVGFARACGTAKFRLT